MKILELNLTAFGHFTNTSLDFSAGNPGLHLIYGANEAGKSTTRRAITQLFYGISERSADAYLHNNDQLRIGARLQRDNGEQLYCYRRKGRKNTLLDANHTPLNEYLLQEWLSGLNEAQFTALFCFDHEQLRQGGEDLLNGGGDVGESLFEAGSGSLKLHELLTELDEEASQLFKARGSKPRLNQTIKTYKTACQRIKSNSLSAHSWQQQAQALEEARQQHTTLTQQLQSVRAAQNRLERIQRTRPLLQRHQELQEELQGLDEVVLLADNASTKRIETHTALRTAQTQAHNSRQTLTELQQHLNGLTIPEKLLAHKTTIDSLRERYGSHLKANHDLPGVRTQMRTVEQTAAELLSQIYPDKRLDTVAQLEITHQQRERLKQLTASYPALREKQASLSERLEKITQQHAQQVNALDSLPEPADLSELQAALNRALKQGELEDSLAAEDQAVRLLTVKLDVGLKQLGLWQGSLEALEQANLPGMERINSYERRFQELDNDRQRIKDRLLEARQHYSRATQKIDALRWAGTVPTEEDLAKARQSRQQQWQTLKHTQPTAAMFQSFEEALLQADEIADRLRREAHRVAEQANLLAERDNALREQEQYKQKWHASTDLLAKLQDEWEECWKPLQIKPWAPAEMRNWLTECLHLRQQVSVLREKRQHLETKQHLIASLCHDLSQALAQLPQGLMPLTRLADLIEQAQACVAEVLQLTHQREDLQRQISNLTHEQQRLATALQQATDALEAWQADWLHALHPLQLAADTPPDIARSVLDTLDQVFNQLGKVHDLAYRVRRMEEDAEVFQTELDSLVQEIAPELVGESVEHIVPTLTKRLQQAEQDATQQAHLQQRVQAEQQRLATTTQAVQTHEAHLQALLEQAHCADLIDLEQAEQASDYKKRIQTQLSEVEQQLLEQGDGMPLSTLYDAAMAVDADRLPGDIQTHSEHIQTLEQERSELDQKIGELRTLLKQMDGNAEAAQAADEAQSALAEIQDLTDRYIEVQLAAMVLRKSIERYREQHQGPLVKRASELFEQLTLGRFCGLKTGYYGSHPQPVLLGLRDPSSEGIPTTGMSDGTRDQLYLALKLASIEHYLQQHPCLPLVLDDILVHFDDTRSAAALSILGQLSQHTQILFFTHHPHLLDIAATHVKTPHLFTHELNY